MNEALTYQLISEILKHIIEACEKQIAESPRLCNNDWVCPNCVHIVKSYQKYCDECGKKLDPVTEN